LSSHSPGNVATPIVTQIVSTVPATEAATRLLQMSLAPSPREFPADDRRPQNPDKKEVNKDRGTVPPGDRLAHWTNPLRGRVSALSAGYSP
jgi:hypothetical protein